MVLHMHVTDQFNLYLLYCCKFLTRVHIAHLTVKFQITVALVIIRPYHFLLEQDSMQIKYKTDMVNL